MTTVLELRLYLGTLSAILWNYGATFPMPTIDVYGRKEVGFSFRAELPGWATPQPAEIKLSEVWESAQTGELRRLEYEYDFIDYPVGHRRAFHGHDPDHFAREFGVLVHEHCEEKLGSPACGHYYGLPIDGFEAIRRFAALWGQDSALGCASLRCMD